MKLTTQQQQAYNLMASGKNIFLTGVAGTGKSKVINNFYNNFRSSKHIVLTSTTGISALLIGGTTLHSYLGIKLGKDTVEDYITYFMENKFFKKRWVRMQTLIIDEVSMLSPELFDKLEKIARFLRQSDEPFGGIQLILTGDFLQLPVVKEDKFCFEAETWDSCIEHIICLDEVFRQDDKKFIDILGKIRMGIVDDDVKTCLGARLGLDSKNEHGIRPTILYPLKKDVERINIKRLEKMATEDVYEYEMDIKTITRSRNEEFALNRFLKNSIVPQKLLLAKGAQVMLIWNIDIDNGLANGSRGIVIDFMEDSLPVVEFVNGEQRVIDYNTWEIKDEQTHVFNVEQIPLVLAYAQTIHKCQGCTLDYVELDLKNVFEYGQAYVALSRIKSLENLFLKDINWDAICAHPRVLEFYEKL